MKAAHIRHALPNAAWRHALPCLRLALLLACVLLLAACNAYDVKLVDPPDSPPTPDDAGGKDAAQPTDAETPDDSGAPPMDASESGSGATGGMDGGQSGSGGEGGMGGEGGAGGSPDASMPDAQIDAACATDEDDSGVDCCPDDPDKTEPLVCGCGVSDVDEDADGTPDCDDGCAQDPNKIAPGECGCGLLDEDGPTSASCVGPRDALLHRYRFEGTGTSIEDSVGDTDGTLVNATLDGSGTLVLAGGSSDQYVDLPNDLVSTLTDATIEAWLVWNGGNPWQRVFDFGDNSSATEGQQGSSGTSYLFLTAATSGSNVARITFRQAGMTEVRVEASAPLASGSLIHVAVVVDDTANELRLYVDGARAAAGALMEPLSGINDINNWIGRSQFQTDPELSATLHELRIYGAALTDAQVTLTSTQGADPAFLEP